MDFLLASPESPIQLPSSNAMNPQPSGNTSVQSNNTSSVGRTGVGESLTAEKHACATVHASEAERSPRDSEGQTDHFGKSPAVAELNAQRQREHEQHAMRQAGVDPLAQSYQKDGTLAKGLEHVLSKNESKPDQGDGQNADSAGK